MRLLFTPKSAYDDFHENAKFRMVWQVSAIMAVALFGLFVMHFIHGEQGWITSLIGCVIASTNLVVLKITGKYKLVAYWSVIGATLLCIALLFIEEDSHIAADTMWCLLVGIFSYYLFDFKIGGLFLSITLISLSLYLLFEDDPTKYFVTDTIQRRTFVAINVLLVGATFGVVLHKMTVESKRTIELYGKQLDQNEILVKEIHHRVKNNLQVISSLLKLQSYEISNSELKGEFEDAVGRIRSMALIHEKMYQKDLAEINIKDYFETLSSEISNSLEVNTEIKVNVKSDFTSVDSKGLVPLSLIFNELMTNSIKHGFKGKDKGVIDVSFHHNKDSIHLSYSDDGTWIEPAKEESFGLEIVRILTEQLDGKCERKTSDKTEFHFQFPIESISFS